MTAPHGAFPLPDEERTEQLAAELSPLLRGGDLLILSGDLGAGKTFFTRALCRSLGIGARVTSPTFTLVHEYGLLESQPGGRPPRLLVSHADLYRLQGEDEVYELDLPAHREEGRVLVVEWGLPYLELLGGEALLLEFSLDPRQVVPASHGQRGAELLAAWLERLAVAPSK